MLMQIIWNLFCLTIILLHEDKKNVRYIIYRTYYFQMISFWIIY